MSLVMPLPPAPSAAARYAVSRSSTPGAGRSERAGSPTPPASARIHSRPATPPLGVQSTAVQFVHLSQALHTISAPPTPVNTTHLLPLPGVAPVGMERCRSSEAVLSHHHHQHDMMPSAVASANAVNAANPVAAAATAAAVVAAAAAVGADTPMDDVRESRNTTPRKPHPLSGPHTLAPPLDLPSSAEVSPLPSPVLGVNDLQAQAAYGGIGPVDEEEDPEHRYADDVDNNVQVDDERMDIDEVEVHVPELGTPTSGDSAVWGMPKWGLEDERPEVRPGVRLVGMEELPALIERHSLLDTPSQVLFPWLHGISDDGAKGREMGAFFGYGPPFEPPPYRGITVVLAPPHPMDRAPLPSSPVNGVTRPNGHPQASLFASTSATAAARAAEGASLDVPRANGDDAASSSTGSYQSGGTGVTHGTSPTTTAESLAPETPPSFIKHLDGSVAVHEVDEEGSGSGSEADVQMHPCESKRVTAPVPDAMPDMLSSSSDSDSDDSYVSEEDVGPSCILMNAVHAQDIFELPMLPMPGRRPSYARSQSGGFDRPKGRFRPARLPNQINLRNLHIQQIKYATVSDIVIYSRNGVGPGVLEIAEGIAAAQEELYQQRMTELYQHCADRGQGEGLDQPVRYGVWVLVEPFTKVERFCPQLVNIDSEGQQTGNSRLVDLFEREAYESRAMTRATEVIEGFWVGNDTDVPGGADDGAGASIRFDLCVKASECSDMPTTAAMAGAYRSLLSLHRERPSSEPGNSWSASPATLALRSLLSPTSIPTPTVESRGHEFGTSPDESHLYAQQHALKHHYVAIDCAGSCRTITGQMRNLATMTDKVVELVTFLRKIVEGRDKTGVKRTVLVHCQDGYTESSIVVLSFIMASLGLTLPEAYLYLQLEAKRSFFLYPTDKPLLHRIEARLAQERRDRAIKCMHGGSSSPVSAPASPTSRWKSWGFMRGGAAGPPAPAPGAGPAAIDGKPTTPTRELDRSPRVVDAARRILIDEGRGGSRGAQDARVWFEDKRFDGFPSRILPYLYLGNIEHAGNAAMLKSLNITHVVSVGESLLDFPHEQDGYLGMNTLAAAARAGHIQVLDLADVRDDGNDPLRPVIARACEWMEQARVAGGSVLVHCRVGVSRSASIVMAYLMKYRGLGLMDAYLVTRARRLNVLIQPNLRFFHELFGWEVELARAEADAREARRREAQNAGVRDPVALALFDQDPPVRRILYSWPTFCRDVHCLNRRFLCN